MTLLRRKSTLSCSGYVLPVLTLQHLADRMELKTHRSPTPSGIRFVCKGHKNTELTQLVTEVNNCPPTCRCSLLAFSSILR